MKNQIKFIDRQKLIDDLARTSSSAFMLSLVFSKASRHVGYGDDGIAADFITRAQQLLGQLEQELKDIKKSSEPDPLF